MVRNLRFQIRTSAQIHRNAALAFLGILCVSASLFAQSQGEKPLKPIEAEGSETYNTLRQLYAAELKKAHEPIDDGFLKALNRLLDETAASGDLEASLAIKKKIESFEKFRAEYNDMIQRALANEMSDNPNPAVADKPMRKMEVGIPGISSKKEMKTETNPFDDFGDQMELSETKWDWTAPGATITFKKDGTAKSVHPKQAADTDRTNYRWKRTSEDTFSLVSVDEVIHAKIQILRDRTTAAYTSMAPSKFSRILNRLDLKK